MLAAGRDEMFIFVSFDHEPTIVSTAPVASEPRHKISLVWRALGVLSSINSRMDLPNAGVHTDVRTFNA